MLEPLVTTSKVEAIGQSDAFLALNERISLAARTDRPVIFIGERGTGKELAAARLHRLSPLWKNPYITLNCASLTPTLIESELFGHEAGAFTGAIRRRKGRFELADGGSLFLDEVANIPLTVQEKILRVTEYGQMERVGGSDSMQVDVRLIAATNVDLRQAAREGKFREDLLDRLSFEVITLPPLRARKEDILILTGHFARRMSAELGLRQAPEFSDRARNLLIHHPWPGNIRELKNVVERMVYRSTKREGAAEVEVIDEVVFDPFVSEFELTNDRLPIAKAGVEEAAGESRSEGGSGAVGKALQHHADFFERIEKLPLPEAVRELEFRRLEAALRESRFNQRKAARRLGLTYDQFRACYRKHKGALGC